MKKENKKTAPGKRAVGQKDTCDATHHVEGILPSGFFQPKPWHSDRRSAKLLQKRLNERGAVFHLNLKTRCGTVIPPAKLFSYLGVLALIQNSDTILRHYEERTITFHEAHCLMQLIRVDLEGLLEDNRE